MINRLIIFSLTILFSSIHAKAQVNFSEDIAPIIYNNCTSCHRTGEIAPFSLANYEEVASWGSMIKYVTEIKYMPPWKPDKNYSRFVGESGLTNEEIQLIADWVEAGYPQGDPSLEPALPDFPSGSQLGTPDLVLEMAEDYFIEGNFQDDYRVFVLPTGLTVDKEIAAIEFRPGNTKAVHHALIAYETEGNAAALDAQTAAYGYESFGDFGVSTQGTFTGYTPGIKTILYPKGIGTTLPAGADLLIQIHYAPLATDETDRSSLNIFFKDENDPITREVQRLPTLPFHLDGGWFSFTIPPNEISTFHGTRAVNQDISLISVYPHSHYLGKDWEIYAETPDNDTINIIRINDWDFNWQGAYTFDRMKKIPSGSTIHVNASYDNTTNNPYNPSIPPQTVTWGESTTDEMYLVGMSYVPYQEGDENIVVGDNTITNTEEVVSSSGIQLLSTFPNPTDDIININFTLNDSKEITIALFDIKGSLVKTFVDKKRYSEGSHQLEFSVQDLDTGIYTLRIAHLNNFTSTSVVVSK